MKGLTIIAPILIPLILACLPIYNFLKRKKLKSEDAFSKEFVNYLILFDKKLNSMGLDLYYLHSWIRGAFNAGDTLAQLKEDKENWTKYERYKEICMDLAHFWATTDHYYWQRLSKKSKGELIKISEEIRTYQPFTPKKISELDQEHLQKHMDVFFRASRFISSFALSQAKLL